MEERRKHNKLFWIFLILFLAAIGCIAFITVRNHLQNIKDRELREKVETSVTEEPEVSAEEEPVQIPVDFATLQAENPDIYAWIRIADTPIDYPILQKEGDDDYYLYRTVDGEEGLPGSIMTEYSYNPHAFSEDPVTVVYGHNMLNDSFFSRLKDFQYETFRKEHETIEIYTPEHIYRYRVFATVTYDNRHILYNYDCNTTEGYQAFLDSLYEVRNMPTWIEDPLPITTDDKMLVLSTCNGNHDQRFLVCAILTEVQ